MVDMGTVPTLKLAEGAALHAVCLLCFARVLATPFVAVNAHSW